MPLGSEFDRYRASGPAHPAARILPAPAEGALARLQEDAQAAAQAPEGRAYLAEVRQTNILADLRGDRAALGWVPVAVVADDPATGLGQARANDLRFPQLMALVAQPERSVDLVSAYFVPGRQFTRALTGLARGGARVRILTNSLNATDVLVVHGACVNYRPDLLRAGVELHELKPAFASDDGGRELRGIAGSSRASLHSKTLAVDERRIFIGWFNFDPRSLLLNTEMGVLIDNPRKAAGVARAFGTTFPAMSYRPALDAEGRMVRDETDAGGETLRHPREPGVTLASRAWLTLLGRLPIEWLL